MTDTTPSPVANAIVSFYTTTSSLIGATSTDALGRYASMALPSGSYYVVAVPQGGSGLIGQQYNGVPCRGGTCVLTAGSTAGVSAPSITPSVDFALPGTSAALTTPTITWANPAGITYPAALGGTQLNATASVGGTFVYSPASGAVLNAGAGQTLGVTFTPTDTTNYTTATASVTINVAKATSTITWANPASISYPTPLSATQLNATANVAGTFVYTPASGTVLNAGAGQTLSVAFTPTNTTNYNTATATVTITVTPFVGPAEGGGWSGTISGSNLIYQGRTYPIVNGRVTFPDCTLYIVGPNGALMGRYVIPGCTPGGGGGISLITPTITWATPAAVTVGTALSGTQLNASSGGVAGTFAYTPASGTVMNSAGTQTLSVVFTPTDTSTYTTATKSVTLTVTSGGGGGGFAGPPTGGWSGTISGSNLIYNGVSYPIVNGRVTFPDCKMWIVGPNGALMGGALVAGCTPGGGTGLITPTITWATPASVLVGTALSATQLNASSGGVAGTLVYTPALGTVMNTAGSQTLSVAFTPTDGATYASASGSVTLVVTSGTFVGPPTGGWSGTVSGSNLIYNGVSYAIVNGRVTFPDCRMWIVAPNGALMGGAVVPGCTPSDRR